MKTHIVTSILIVFGLYAGIVKSQDLPNGGFEDWEKSILNVEQPKGWFTSSLFTPYAEKKPVEKAVVEKYNGNSAIRLETIRSYSGGEEQVIPGYAITGKFDFSGLQVGFPYESRPAKLRFFYKYAPNGEDTMVIQVVLQKHIEGYGNITVGSGYYFTSENIPQYTLGEIKIDYDFPDQPDTAIVYMLSGTDTVRTGSVLFVDEMRFEFPLGSADNEDVSKTDPFTAQSPYPQPVRANSTINFPLQLNENNIVKLEIFDLAGKIVNSSEKTLPKGSNKIELSTSGLKQGMYTYKISCSSHVQSGKIMISE